MWRVTLRTGDGVTQTSHKWGILRREIYCDFCIGQAVSKAGLAFNRCRCYRFRDWKMHTQNWQWITDLPTRRYASAGTSYMTLCPSVCVCVCLSVGHKWVFYRNGSAEQADFWHGGFFRPIIHCVLRKFRYLQKQGCVPLELFSKLRTWKFRHGISIVEMLSI